MITSSECRAARKAKEASEREQREAHYRRATAHQIDPITWMRDRRYGRNEPNVDWARDPRILLAQDLEREMMEIIAAEREQAMGLSCGSGT